MFKRKKKNDDRLTEAFGKLKDDVFDFSLIDSYFKNKDNTAAYQVISDKTCNDLDIEELFTFIDRTTSKVGQQCLYNKLRTIPVKPVKDREKLIHKLATDKAYRISIQREIDLLSQHEAFHISSLFQEEHTRPPKWFIAIRLLSLVSLASLLITPILNAMILVFIATYILNIGIHLWNKRNVYKYLTSIPQLIKLSQVAKELHKNELCKDIDPTLEKSLKVIDQVKNRMAFFKIESALQSDFGAIAWGILELFKIAFLLEPLLLFDVLHRLDTRREAIEKVFSFVGEIDCLISIASLREGLELHCMPEIETHSTVTKAEKIYHPLIQECVKNTIHLQNKSVLLTGSNMSGKTSFIRTIGINIITGLTLNTCFAESIRFPKMRIYSAIRISDDLMNDKSYYFEEVLTIKEMMDRSDDDVANLFLLDEIFKGTNTIERISAGKAVLSSLTKNKNLVFVSTHDIELTDLLNKEYELYHFSEVVNQNKVDFDYKLKAGKLKNRNAIRILQINDYPAEVINEAMQIAKRLDKEG